MKVFFMDPHCPVREPKMIEVEIIVCKKSSWAVLSNGSRRLVGASIFFTLASANRARLGALQRFVKNATPYIQFKYPDLCNRAKKALDQLQKGTVH